MTLGTQLWNWGYLPFSDLLEVHHNGCQPGRLGRSPEHPDDVGDIDAGGILVPNQRFGVLSDMVVSTMLDILTVGSINQDPVGQRDDRGIHQPQPVMPGPGGKVPISKCVPKPLSLLKDTVYGLPKSTDSTINCTGFFPDAEIV